MSSVAVFYAMAYMVVAWKLALSSMIQAIFRERRAMGQGVTIGALIGGVIFLYVMAALMPGVITNIENVTQTKWTATEKTLWSIVGIIVIAGLIVGVWRGFAG